MKKVVSLLIAFAGALCAISGYADETVGLTGIYTSTDITVSFEGRFAQPCDYAVISLFPAGSERNTASDDCLIMTSVVDDNGSFSGKIVLPDNFRGNEYIMYASNGTEEYTFEFVHINEVNALLLFDELKDMEYDDFKKTILDNAVDLGIKSGALTDADDEIINYIYKQMPSAGYSSADFQSAYMRAVVLNTLKGSENKEALLRTNSTYFGVDFEQEFSKLNESQKSIVISKISSDDFSEVIFEEEFSRITFYAKLKTSESYSALQKLFLENSDYIEPDFEYWEKIDNDYYKQLVFKNLYKQDFESLSELTSLFYTESKNCYRKYEESTDTQSSSSGGSRGSGSFVSPAAIVPTDDNAAEIGSGINDAVINVKPVDLNGHWAQDIVCEMYSKNLINGYSDGTFMPDNEITRAEFVKLIVTAFDIKLTEYAVFDDVNSDDWYYKYVSSAYDAGIIKGTGDVFEPDKYITRQDAATMLFRIKESYEPVKTAEFKDIDLVAEYAKVPVNTLALSGIINGYEGYFKPLYCLTRAESAAMIYRMIDMDV